MKTVWITRTESQKPSKLPAGWQAINAPLLTVAPASKLPEAPNPEDVLIFTSANGVKIFSSYSASRHWPVYTVGDATAAAAKTAGFETVQSAGGNVAALQDLITNTIELKSKRFYYASGQDISGDLTGNLRLQGFDIERHVLYETTSIKSVPLAFDAFFETNNDLTVLLYSPKGAKIFSALDLNFSKINTISISQNVDANLAELGLKSRKIAQYPTHKAMIKQLG